MANYFSKFPLVYYNLTKGGNSQIVTNILSRYVIEKNIRENMIFYDRYEIRDGDTPENLAHKLYDSAERHWLILAANDIVDVESQWPLTEQQFNRHVNEKYFENGDGSEYSGLEWAKNNYRHYYRTEKIIMPRNVETINSFEIDSNTYVELANSVSSYTTTLSDGNEITVINNVDRKTYYQSEYEENEDKRLIKILRFQYLDAVEQELERVFSEEQLNTV